MPGYESVAQYHVDSDRSEDGDWCSGDEENGLMFYRRGGSRVTGNIRMFSSFDHDHNDDEVVTTAKSRDRLGTTAEQDAVLAAAAAAELDGNRPRKHNPLTIIQVKNPERNLDDGAGSGTRSTFHWPVKWPFHTSSHHLHPRKQCCVVSLAGCLLLVGLFLWAAPCDETSQTCQEVPSALANRHRRTTEWTKVYDNIALTSGLEVVDHPNSNTPLVVSGYTSDKSFGLLGFRPQDGEERWRRSLHSKPHKHDCNLVDVNVDGQADCLVVGEHGLLAAINPRNGDELWYLEHHIPLVNVSLPRRLPDLDGDGVSELVAACAVTFPSEISDDHIHIRTNFILLSGRHGKVMGRPYLVETCTDIGAINVTSDLALQFDCTSHYGADQFEMSLEEFYNKATNEQLNMDQFGLESSSKGGRAAEYRQFDAIGEVHTETVKDNIHLDWTLAKHQCPECGVTVKIWDGFAHRLLWNHSWARAVAFEPLSTRYETDRKDSPIEGFVFRLWEWHFNVGDTFTVGADSRTVAAKKDSTTTTSKPHLSEAKEEQEEEEDSYSLENLFKSDRNNDMAYEDSYSNYGTSGRLQQQPSPYEWISNMIPFGHPNLGGPGSSGRRLLSVDTKTSYKKNGFQKHHLSANDNKLGAGSSKRHNRPVKRKKNRRNVETVRMLNVTETLFYATLNHTSPQLARLFSHTLVQRCRLKPPEQSYQCRPHYNTMSNSMVIINHSSSEADWRDLVFASHSLVDMSSKGQQQQQQQQHQQKDWRLRTTVHKLRLGKDIRKVPHL